MRCNCAKRCLSGGVETVFSNITLFRTPLGQVEQVSSLERCPHFRGTIVHMSIYVSGTVGTVLVRVS